MGAGTGLSDADRDYAQSVVAGDITVDAEAMKRILLIAKQANEGIIKNYYDRRSAIRSELEKTNQESALALYPEVPALNQPLVAPEKNSDLGPNLRWDETLQDFVRIN